MKGIAYPRKTYCHTHGRYDCPTCAEIYLVEGIRKADARIAELERQNAELVADKAKLKGALLGLLDCATAKEVETLKVGVLLLPDCQNKTVGLSGIQAILETGGVG